MFLQNFIKLSAAVHELSCQQRKKQLKTILLSLPLAVKSAVICEGSQGGKNFTVMEMICNEIYLFFFLKDHQKA